MIDLDRESLLCLVRGATRVAEVERALSAHALTLGLTAVPEQSVAAWIADGAPGVAAPWSDPADHLVAGFAAHFPDGRLLEVRPAPRRSVGPDLFALVLGQKGRYVTLVECWLRVHVVGTRRPSAPFRAPTAPTPTAAEIALSDAIARELATAPRR
jgi:alkyldihydroxyacetonephosphate synthase